MTYLQIELGEDSVLDVFPSELDEDIWPPYYESVVVSEAMWERYKEVAQEYYELKNLFRRLPKVAA